MLAAERKFDQAEPLLRRFLQKAPGHLVANHMLGMTLMERGKFTEAKFFAERAVELSRGSVPTLTLLGTILLVSGKDAEAEAALRRACEADPGSPTPLGPLAELYRKRGDAAMSVEFSRRALELDPSDRDALKYYGWALMNTGRSDEALRLYRLAMDSLKGDLSFMLNHAFLASYCGGNDGLGLPPEEILALYRAAAEVIESWGVEPRPPIRDPDPDRTLGVGFISPDLRTHSVANFIEPILEHHDREQARIVCFSNSPVEDDVTKRLRSWADGWHSIAGMHLRGLCDLMRSEKIDILIDLAGHTGGGSIAELRIRPAPILATYCGFPNTTGVNYLDARIVCEATDPSDGGTACTEPLLRLPGPFLCYRPPGNAPEIQERDPGAPFVFGSFNAAHKITPAVARFWAEILRRSGNARLLVKATTGVGTGEWGLAKLRESLVAAGVPSDRLDVMGHTAGRREHLEVYHRVDVALDTFPYNGTTTTCEALWMGVPVQSVQGRTHMARVSSMILHAAGLGEFVAANPNDYVTHASNLAANPNEVRSRRVAMRTALAASPVMKEKDFVRGFEATLRGLWRMRLAEPRS